MPLYEYRCTVCGYSFEKIQNFSAEPERECPKCNGVLIRPVTAPALRFEGAGWYVNDYAGKSGAAKSAESSGATSSGSSDGKESKTEAKTGPSDSSTSSSTATPAAAPAAASSTPSSSSGS